MTSSEAYVDSFNEQVFSDEVEQNIYLILQILRF